MATAAKNWATDSGSPSGATSPIAVGRRSAIKTHRGSSVFDKVENPSSSGTRHSRSRKNITSMVRRSSGAKATLRVVAVD